MDEHIDAVESQVEEESTPIPQEETGVTEAPTGTEEAVEHPDGSGEMIPRSRFNEVYAKWKDTERELELERAMKIPAPTPEPEQLVEPQMDGYETYESYFADLAEFKAKKVLRDNEMQRIEGQREQNNQARVNEFQRKGNEFATEHPDYFAKVQAIPPQFMPQDVADVIMDSENGPAIAYHLGENPHEAARIAQLPSHLRTAEIGRISATIKPTEKKPTQAPPPVKPLGGSDSAPRDWKDDDNISNEEWQMRRWKEKKERR
jgi:hypothetical protein